MDRIITELFSYDKFIHAFSGATASVIAITTFYPLDSARTRIQVDHNSSNTFSLGVILEIYKKEGTSGVYRGLISIIQALGVSNFVYFYAYNTLKSIRNERNSSAISDLFLGFIAGTINVLLTTPLWVANTRLKLQGSIQEKDKHKLKYSGVIDCIRKIIKKEKLSNLWSGTKASIILASNPAIQWMFYESLKRYISFNFGIEEKQFSSYVILFIGAVAKLLATVLTYPLQLIQTKSRAFNKSGSSFNILKTIIEKDGFFAIYTGLEAKLTQTVLTAAFMLVIYEKISRLLISFITIKQ